MKTQYRDTLCFTLMLAAFMLILVLMTFGYDRETRLMPLIVGIPTLLLLLFQIVLQFNPSLQKRFEIDMFSLSSSGRSKTEGKKESESLLFHTALIIAYFVFILFFGFLVATPVYLLIFFRTHGKQSWIKCLIGAGFAWVLLYLIFSVAMKYTLFEGVLFGARL